MNHKSSAAKAIGSPCKKVAPNEGRFSLTLSVGAHEASALRLGHGRRRAWEGGDGGLLGIGRENAVGLVAGAEAGGSAAGAPGASAGDGGAEGIWVECARHAFEDAGLGAVEGEAIAGAQFAIVHEEVDHAGAGVVVTDHAEVTLALGGEVGVGGGKLVRAAGAAEEKALG